MTGVGTVAPLGRGEETTAGPVDAVFRPASGRGWVGQAVNGEASIMRAIIIENASQVQK